MKMQKKRSIAPMIALAFMAVMAGVVLFYGCGVSSYQEANTPVITVAVPPGTLQSIALSDSNGDGTVLNGHKDYFTATGTYLNNGTTSTHDITTLVTWSSSDPTIADVKTYNVGMGGMGIMGHLVGTATITATYGTVSQSTTLTVLFNAGY